MNAGTTRLRTLFLACIWLGSPLDSRAAEQVDCAKQPSQTAAAAEQGNRLQMCALIGIWDTIVLGNNRHRYSGEVAAWVDDSVTAVRAAIHNLDLLQCANLEPSALAQATLQLVTQISDEDFGKNTLKPFEMASSPQQSPCGSSDTELPDKLVTFVAGASPGYFQSSTCAFGGLEFPDEFVVLAASAYAGRRTGFQIDQSGHEGTQIDVAVNHVKPVVLMLGAYEPTIWNIVWTPGTQIVAVLASGYHRQIVAGLKGNVPIMVSSNDNHGACGYFHGNRTAVLDPLSRRIFSRPVDMVYRAQDGKVLIGQ